MSDADRWEGALERAGEPAELAPEHEPPATSRRPRDRLGRRPRQPAHATCARRSARPASRGRGPRSGRAPRLRSRAGASATRGGRFCTRRATPATRQPSPRPARWPPPTGGCARRRCRSWRVRSSRRRCGRGRSRCTSGSAGSHPGRRSSRSRATSPATSGRPRIARSVALGAVAPAPLLLIGDLGRPERFLNMLRIFKPRSPMNMGAWCLVALQRLGGARGRRRPRAQAQGRASVRASGARCSARYLGSYTGVLLACTAVPVWSRSRALLGPIFVATATATGAAATRLALVARGLPDHHPTGTALAHDRDRRDADASCRSPSLNERRLGDAAEALRRGRPGILYRAAKGPVVLGLSRAGARPPRGGAPTTSRACSTSPRGSTFRFAWVFAGRASAGDDAVVAAGARRPARPRRLDPPRPRCRCRTRRAGPTGRRSGARASRSNGWRGGETTSPAARPSAGARSVCVQYERKIDHARSALRLPQGDLARGGSGGDAPPARRALARGEHHGGAEPPRPVSHLDDVVDLDIRQPQEALGRALDDAATDRAAGRTGLTGTRAADR